MDNELKPVEFVTITKGNLKGKRGKLVTELDSQVGVMLTLGGISTIVFLDKEIIEREAKREIV